MKTNSLEYVRLHYWVAKQLGRPKLCDKCGLDDPKRRYEWSNISGDYLKDLSDWQRLCVPCHAKKDKRKAYCKKGHELVGDNLIIHSRGWRRCRTCQNDINRIYNRKKYGYMMPPRETI